jgi:hypothetical protein
MQAPGNHLGSFTQDFDAPGGTKFRGGLSKPASPSLVAVYEEPAADGPDEGQHKGRQAAAAAQVCHEARGSFVCHRGERDAPNYLVLHISWSEEAKIAGAREKMLKVFGVPVGKVPGRGWRRAVHFRYRRGSWWALVLPYVGRARVTEATS